MNLLDRLAGSRNRAEIILEAPGAELTLDQVHALCESLADVLADKDILLLALHADNGVDWVVADLVCQQLDICLVPLPTFFSPLQIRAGLAQCRAPYLLTDDPHTLAPLIDSRTAHAVAGTGLHLCRMNDAAGETALLPAGTGKITFTSGSTGEPRGVCLSNEQLLRQADRLANVVGLQQPRHLCLLPLSTLLENVAGIYAPLLAGGRVILPSLADLGYQGSRLVEPARMLGHIRQTTPDSLILIPELLKLLVAAAANGWQPPGSLTFIAVGGSRVSKGLLEQAHAVGLPVYEGYGLSECASVVSLNTPGDNRVGSCGKVLPGLDVTLSAGEVNVRGNAMLGYLNQPQSWYPERIRTGDIGTLDEAGFLHLEGRKRNLLISSYGRNISPEWPESELTANSLVQEAVVFGDASPWCVALISPRDPMTDDGLIQAWVDRVNAGLPDYARVLAWHRLDVPLANIPGLMTRNGRPRRAAIARKFAHTIESLYLNGEPSPAKGFDHSTNKEQAL